MGEETRDLTLHRDEAGDVEDLKGMKFSVLNVSTATIWWP